jgi:hypothetical protein
VFKRAWTRPFYLPDHVDVPSGAEAVVGMTTVIAAIVPPTQSSLSTSRPRVGRVFPVPELASRRASSTVYGLAAVDRWGRITDRVVLRALGWSPGTRLGIRERSRLLVATAEQSGSFAVSRQGHLRLPVEARRWCGLSAGDRVLLAADTADGVLLIYPPAALDVLVSAHLSGGEAV